LFCDTRAFTAINLASCLGDEAKNGEILRRPRAAISVEEDFDVISNEYRDLESISGPVEVFWLADTKLL
jgi:hypothetical protein